MAWRLPCNSILVWAPLRFVFSEIYDEKIGAESDPQFMKFQRKDGGVERAG